MLIHSSRIVIFNTIKDGYLEINNGKIIRFYDATSHDLKADIDYGDHRIIPGIFDTHNHGGFGYRIDNASKDEIRHYLKGLASVGVTEIFPTTTVPEAMEKVYEVSREINDGATIMGIHSEGPWGARVGEKGVNTGYPAVDLNVAQTMVEKSHGLLKLVDIAPEVDRAKDAIDFFLSHGITMAMYHTNANYQQANKGVDWGITVATHLGNVMTGLHHRDVGTLGCGLLRDEVDCELICDGLHVSLPMIQIMLKVKDHNHIMMVSDNVQYCGAPKGRYVGMNQDPNSDRKYINVTEDGFVLSDSGRLSGSSKPVIYGIGNLVEKLHMPLEEVTRFFAENPNRKYGFIDRKGSLEPGKDADFVVISDDYQALVTYVNGRIVYDRNVDGTIFNDDFIKTYRIGD